MGQPRAHAGESFIALLREGNIKMINCLVKMGLPICLCCISAMYLKASKWIVVFTIRYIGKLCAPPWQHRQIGTVLRAAFVCCFLPLWGSHKRLPAVLWRPLWVASLCAGHQYRPALPLWLRAKINRAKCLFFGGVAAGRTKRAPAMVNTLPTTGPGHRCHHA